jgi:flavin-binding protein dodecin
MNELLFPFLEVVGYSTTTLAEAISNALMLIDRSLHQPLWVEKVATKAVMDKDQLAGWQVVPRIGFAGE